MRGCYSFMKKEALEMIRTYRLLVTVLVFLAIGMMNPLFARFTPELLASFAEEGVTITIADPTAFDSWSQFFSNIVSIGFLVILIFVGTSMTREFTRGTLIPVLTRGLSRKAVMTAKLIMSILLWTAGYLIAGATTYIYTAYLFEDALISNLFLALLGLWLFGVLLIAILTFGGMLTGNTAGCLLVTGLIIGFLFLFNLFPPLQEYNPLQLASGNMNLIRGYNRPADFIKAGITAGAAIVVFVSASYAVFQKRKI